MFIKETTPAKDTTVVLRFGDAVAVRDDLARLHGNDAGVSTESYQLLCLLERVYGLSPLRAKE
jgi:hypothetical protein